VKLKLHIPYRYAKSGIILLFLIQSIHPAFSQDTDHRPATKDSVFPHVDSLKAAIVTAAPRPKMKGDTVEFNTAHIRLRAYANVEELLGRLPGLEIDADGSISYNGQKIQHLLVDGEDIFGNNPTLMTRNFDASKIDRVQILDRKSDNSLFTGIDDGSRTKTLNLVLKESAKDGYSGKVELGGNPKGYYNSKALLAGFKNKAQFVALGFAANTGATGYSNNSDGGASIAFNGRIPDPLGATAGAGIPQFFGLGLHYANTTNEMAAHFAGNYQFGHYLTRPEAVIQTLQIEPGYLYQQEQKNASLNQQDQHWGYGTYDWLPSPNKAFRLTFNASSGSSQNQLTSANSVMINDTLANKSLRTVRDSTMQQNIDVTTSFRTQLGRPGRLLSLSANFARVNNTTTGNIFSSEQFFGSAGELKSQDTADQRKRISSQPLTLGANLNYTEPLWHEASLAASYRIVAINNNDIQATYARGTGKYDELIDSLSGIFQTRKTSQTFGLTLTGKMKHLSYVTGLQGLAYSYQQRTQSTGTLLRQNNLNWAPKLILNYTPGPALRLGFLYTVNAVQPSISQLQPTKNNNDPIHLTIGNPNLKPAFNQDFNLNFNWFTAWIVNADLSLNLVDNAISTKTTTDSLGRQISQPVNIAGNKTFSISGNISHKLFGFDVGFRSRLTLSQLNNYLNADFSRNNLCIEDGIFSISRSQPDKYAVQLNSRFSHFSQTSSINSSASVRYWTQEHSLALTTYLLRNYEINATGSYLWQQKTSSFNNSASTLLMNCSVTRTYFKNKLSLRAQWNNIFNQNADFGRSINYNSTTQYKPNILGRYWLLSVIYHFDKKFARK